MKQVSIRSVLSWSILGVLFFAQTASAATTVGTNLSTTGTFDVTAGLATFAGGVSVSTNFEVTGARTFGINAGAATETTLEVGGTASISGAFTFGDGSATGAITTSDWAISATGVMTGISGITTNGVYTQSGASANTFTGQSIFSGGASFSYNLELTGASTYLGINVINTNQALEVGGTASISSIFAITNLVAGNNTASSSATYVAEFANASTTASTSVLFGGPDAQTVGTCLQLKSTTGRTVYLRVNDAGGTPALLVNYLECR